MKNFDLSKRSKERTHNQLIEETRGLRTNGNKLDFLKVWKKGLSDVGSFRKPSEAIYSQLTLLRRNR